MATATNSANSSTGDSSNSPGNVSHSLIALITSITIQNITGMVPTKLNRQNYITWRSLFIPVLKRFKLLQLVNGTDLCLPQLVCDLFGSRVPNPAFDLWCERDQILMNWINSTLSENLIPLTVGMDDSQSLWQLLERRFASASHTHVHSLHSKIQTIQKGNSSMSDYLNSLK